MRILPFTISVILTVALVIALNCKWGQVTPLGSFFSPQHGFWQNAEPAIVDFNQYLELTGLKGKVNVFLDERLVPHVMAGNDADTYWVQGYLHAKFRLWQMEFQTHVAAGRLCEIMGKGLDATDLLETMDRHYRRLGMGWAAEHSLKKMEADSTTKATLDAYTAGVNAYIASLNASELPIEYKLLHYTPEPWTNLKTALFLKFMSLALAGNENDFELTNAHSIFSGSDFDLLYPSSQDSVSPIIPLGTLFLRPGRLPVVPGNADSIYYQAKGLPLPYTLPKPDKENGSNNWAVAGSKTTSGAPILCNDPHLPLNLPSLWYEMQLNSPQQNAYGVSFPGAPGIIIGFNDSCSWGFTNAERDVRDYFEIIFKDNSRKEYWHNNEWLPTEFRYEHIKIRGAEDFIDTVAYTIFGPVMFEPRYPDMLHTGKYYACRWSAHDPGDELKAFTDLDHAHNYNDYLAAIKYLHTPGQNCVFAAKNGDIALWCQGKFPAKWFRQGDFVMPGTDDSYAWQDTIPQEENPHQLNPLRGFVSSANQYPADVRAYPYYLGGFYPPFRGLIINRKLESMEHITAEDMQKMQTDNYNVFAEMARPILLKYLSGDTLQGDSKKYYELVRSWNLRNDTAEKGATVFSVWWENFYSAVYDDELSQTKLPIMEPANSTLLEGLLRDPNYKFVDDIHTSVQETIFDCVAKAWATSVPSLKTAEENGLLQWSRFKDTYIGNLAHIEAFGRSHISVGGDWPTINATVKNHGPSWRMVVELTATTQAYGIYPGGQSGNPGSVYYDDYVNDWAAGKYYPLLMLQPQDKENKHVRWIMNFNKANL